MEIPTNNILFLKGVFPEDCIKIEDQYMEKLNDMSTLEQEPSSHKTNDIKKRIIYDKIQKQFKDIKSWVELTKDIKIKCWYCESMFMGVPVFVPSSIHDTPRGKVYDIHGIFCSFGCSYAYIQDSAEFVNDKSVWDKIEMLKMLYYHFYNKRIDNIIPSPNKYRLEQYGGDMTLSDYKKELKKINAMNINGIQH